MRAEVAWAAAEDRRTVAETILDILTDWLIAREAAGKSKISRLACLKNQAAFLSFRT
jgi:hypothetical protein